MHYPSADNNIEVIGNLNPRYDSNSVAVDSVNDYLYLVDYNVLVRSNLDGSAQTPILHLKKHGYIGYIGSIEVDSEKG